MDKKKAPAKKKAVPAKKKHDPMNAPIGDGSAAKARKDLKNRNRRIDDYLDSL